jgi:hypothetical protein
VSSETQTAGAEEVPGVSSLRDRRNKRGGGRGGRQGLPPPKPGAKPISTAPVQPPAKDERQAVEQELKGDGAVEGDVQAPKFETSAEPAAEFKTEAPKVEAPVEAPSAQLPVEPAEPPAELKTETPVEPLKTEAPKVEVPSAQLPVEPAEPPAELKTETPVEPPRARLRVDAPPADAATTVSFREVAPEQEQRGLGVPTDAEKPRRVNWNLHAKNTRTALMTWAAAVGKVRDRADDVQQTIQMAGANLATEDLAAIVGEVASRTGLSVAEVAAVAGVPAALVELNP